MGGEHRGPGWAEPGVGAPSLDEVPALLRSAGDWWPVASYGPVSLGADLVGDRWTLLIVRELLDGTTRFNDLHRGLPGLSRSLLTSRPATS